MDFQQPTSMKSAMYLAPSQWSNQKVSGSLVASHPYPGKTLQVALKQIDLLSSSPSPIPILFHQLNINLKTIEYCTPFTVAIAMVPFLEMMTSSFVTILIRIPPTSISPNPSLTQLTKATTPSQAHQVFSQKTLKCTLWYNFVYKI
jgi:hypothetical protein